MPDLPAVVATPAAQDEPTLVLMLDDDAAGAAPAASARPRPRRARPEPTTTMEVMVPQALAQELQQALSVLPGLSLDELATQALARVLSQAGVPRLACRRRSDGALVVLV